MKEEKYVIREPLRTGKELADIKVTNMVGTFSNKGGDDFQKIRVPPTKTEPQKVASTVATFLNEGSDGFQKIRITTTQTGPKKVASTVATFLNEDSYGLWIIGVNNFINQIFKQFRQMKLSKNNHLKQNKEYSETPDFNILFAPISTKGFF